MLTVVLATIQASALDKGDDGEDQGYQAVPTGSRKSSSARDLNEPDMSAADRYRSKNVRCIIFCCFLTRCDTLEIETNYTVC